MEAIVLNVRAREALLTRSRNIMIQAACVYPMEFKTSFMPVTAVVTTGVGCASAGSRTALQATNRIITKAVNQNNVRACAEIDRGVECHQPALSGSSRLLPKPESPATRTSSDPRTSGANRRRL